MMGSRIILPLGMTLVFAAAALAELPPGPGREEMIRTAHAVSPRFREILLEGVEHT